MKCESCLYKYRTKFLEKENKYLQDSLNEIVINYYNKLVENLLLKDKIEYLEKELTYATKKTKI